MTTAGTEHIDPVPVGAVLLQGATQDGIGVVEGAQGRVGEHDTEAEGVFTPIALEESQPEVREGGLQQGRDEEPAGPSADDCNVA
ncbi:hypothetical protein Kisp02_30870 [Kineosporia sp. NBRC 101731]|nr:hypothetical protein Kisp02_30870 [Kineosporia sp. NBRC 101731]